MREGTRGQRTGNWILYLFISAVGVGESDRNITPPNPPAGWISYSCFKNMDEVSQIHLCLRRPTAPFKSTQYIEYI